MGTCRTVAQTVVRERGTTVAKGRLVAVCLCALGVAISSWGLVAAPADGAATHEFLKQIKEVPALGPKGEAIAEPGPLSRVTELTTHAGELYVAEAFGPERVDTFNDTSGSFLQQFPLEPSFAAQGDLGLAVSTSTGATEVLLGADTTGETCAGKVLVHNGKGALIGEWSGADTPTGPFGCALSGSGVGGLAADNGSALTWASGDVYVANAGAGKVDVFKPLAGGGEEFISELEPEPGVGFQLRENEPMAVNPANGNLAVANGGSKVEIFKPAAITGQFEKVGTLTGTPKGSFGDVGAIATDGSDLFVVDRSVDAVDEFDASNSFLGRLTGTSSGAFGETRSVAVDTASHDVYVGDRAEKAVDVFGPNQVVPDVTTESASAVAPTTATLNGTVNPDAIAVNTCHFEYGTTTAYGSTANCVPAPGAGSSPVAVHANITGLTPGATYHFRLAASNVHGTNTGEDRRLGPPTVGAETAEPVEQTTVTLHALIDPNGVATHYQFEYGTTAAYGSSAPVPEESVGAGETAQEVAVPVSGLQPGVRYHYRVVAVNGSGSTDGVDRVFTTIPAAQIDSVTISEVGPSSALLEARINPLSNDTKYHFEYGPTTAYGTSVPIPGADIGSGSSDVPVSQSIAGLTPNTTYHVRVVAENAVGTSASPDHTFTFREGASTLPDGRALEMVTPPVKNASLIGDVTFGVPPVVADDGSQLILGAVQCFAGAVSCEAVEPQGNGSPYSFERTATGWTATPLAPSATEFHANSWWEFSADHGPSLFSVEPSLSAPFELVAREPGGALSRIGPLEPEFENRQNEVISNSSKAATGDLSHAVFTDSGGPVWSFDSGSGGSVYEYSGRENSAPLLVGVEGPQGSTKRLTSCRTELGGAINELPYGDLSADGRTVYFTAEGRDGSSCSPSAEGPPVSELFARIDGEAASARTVAISEPNALASAPPDLSCKSAACVENISTPANFRDAQFIGASTDGGRVFFTDTQQLTDAASQDPEASDSAHVARCGATSGVSGCNLYMYRDPQAEPLTGNGLLDLSAGDTTGLGPRVQGVMGISSDGSHVYFVAKGVLTTAPNTEGGRAESDANNLYMWTDAADPEGHVAFVAALPDADREEWKSDSGIKANVTPDGRLLVFTSAGRLTADTTRTDGAQQVFRYDAETGALTRVSIGQQGFADNGNDGVANASIVPASHGFARLGPGRPDPTMSHDGEYVFFMSPNALTPHALNDKHIGTGQHGEPEYAQNVYEYHGGEVSLISDGKDGAGAPSEICVGLSAVCLVGTDATGHNVFFSTADELLPQDTDTELDYYDARICSAGEPCLTPPPELPAPCSGEGCRGATSSPSPTPAAGSSTFTGPGNLSPVPSKTSPKPPTRTQLLAKALRSCRRKHNRHTRTVCERSARKRYGSQASSTKRKRKR
jgi:hypothetical protein